MGASLELMPVNVRVITGEDVGAWGDRPVRRLRAAPGCWGSWRPALTLGAQPVGGLMLPDAHPSRATMYAPRGVWIDAQRLVVCDTGNHRVLIWNAWPDASGAPADVVLGQPDEGSEGPNAGGPAAGMNLPTGVLVDAEGRLVVADAWNHRVLVWDTVPVHDRTEPDYVIGQPDRVSMEPNRGGTASAESLYWPFGIALIGQRFYVCDTGNRRVLIWERGLPLDGRPADVALGQPDFSGRDENRGAQAGPCSFRWPHAVSPVDTGVTDARGARGGVTETDGGGVYVADAGNHRVLRWDSAPVRDQPADGVIGQPDFASSSEFPYRPQAGHLRFPYAVCGPGLAVADTANNRVLIWDRVPLGADPPDVALAQRDFASNGENRWEQVTDDTLCWPYGLARHGDRLAVADSGNNRVVVWELAAAGDRAADSRSPSFTTREVV